MRESEDFWRERNEAVSQAALKTVERNSVNACYSEIFPALWSIANAWKKCLVLQILS